MSLTREGRRFLLATFLIGVAALNTGNNLIYLILALMLAVAILALAVALMNLTGLSVSLLVDPPAFCGEARPGSIVLKNAGKFLSSSSVRIESDALDQPVYVPSVAAGTVRGEEAVFRFARRGILKHGDALLRSSFPFILFERRVKANVSGETLVYPRRIPVDRIVGDQSVYGDDGVLRRGVSGDDLVSLREFRSGDDRRDIHWKASAKRSTLLVREYAGRETRNVTIFLDNQMPHEPRLFEKAVAAAASLCDHFLMQGDSVRLITCRKVVPFGVGIEHLFTILDILAVIEETDCRDYPRTDSEEISLLVLKSAQSGTAEIASSAGRVVYADAL